MNAARASIAAIARSEQQRETLLIMLSADFDVTAAASAEALAQQRQPAALVLAAASDASAPWDDAAVLDTVERWGSAGLVLIDAPPAVARRFPQASVASWSDPFSLPSQVAAAASVAPRAGSTWERVLATADLSLRPQLESASALVALVEVSRRPESTAVAARFLGQRLRRLTQSLAWVDWFDEEEGADVLSTADFAAVLRRVVSEDEWGWSSNPIAWSGNGRLPLRTSPARLRVLARCLCALLRERSAAPAAIHAGDEEIVVAQAAVRDAAASFAREAVASLLRGVHARFEDDESGFRIAMEDVDAGPSA